MTDTFRALCAELLGALENEGYAHWPGGADGDPLIERARALLAETEAVGPSDDELLELGQLYCISYTLSDGTVVSPYREGTDMRSEVLSFARAVLARFGGQR